jgi:hypothetical protein
MTSARDRQLWTRSRGVLSTLLGRYLGTDPRALRFVRGAHGKPSLLDLAAGASDAAAITPGGSFSLSHSGELALYAFTALSASTSSSLAGRSTRSRSPHAPSVRSRPGAWRPRPGDPQAGVPASVVSPRGRAEVLGLGVGGAEAGSGSRRPWIGQLEMGAVAAGAVAAEELCCRDWPPPADSPYG